MWETFSNTIDDVAKHDREQAKELLFAFYEYASWGREPGEFSDWHLSNTFEATRFNLDSSIRSCSTGKAGGKKKAENAKKRQQQQEEDSKPDADELKRAKKAIRAHGKLYEAIVDDVIPDDVLEEQAGWAEDLSEAFAREAMLG
jgi:hypothetical protein